MKALIVISTISVYAQVGYERRTSDSMKIEYKIDKFSDALTKTILWCTEAGIQDFTIIDTRML